MNQNSFQVAIVGYGRAGSAHAAAWKSLDGARVAAVVDNTVEGRELAAGRGFDTFEDLNALAASGLRIDAASVSTPTVFHETQAVSLLASGIPVLCETPAATTLESALRLLDAASEYGVPFQTASRLRHLPEIRKARALLSHGVIGDPVLFQGDFSRAEDMSNRWNSVPQFSGGGVLMAQGCDAADLVRFLISPVVKAQAVPVHAVQTLGVEDSAMVLFTTECGTSGNVTLSWSLTNASGVYFTIHGTRGSLDLGWDESWLRVDGEAPIQIGQGTCESLIYRRMATNFRELCRSGEDQWIAAADILSGAAAMESAYRSMQTGRWSRVAASVTSASRAQHGTRAVAACS